MQQNPSTITPEIQNQLKQLAANTAVDTIESGMIVGLGHGSTALLAVRRLAELLQHGKLRDILAIPCSSFMQEEALRLGITLTTLDEHPTIDLTIDGADEVDPELHLIKGGGGALLREKIIAEASKREIIIVDESKLSPKLGTKWAVPIEVVPLALAPAKRYLESIGANVVLRTNSEGNPFLTDQRNFILDAHFGLIENPRELAQKIKVRAGIVEHGLFIGIASEVIVAGVDGIRILKSSPSRA